MKKEKHRLNNLHYLKDLRKSLRNGCTTTENILWSHICHSKLHGRKFRRQHSIGPYIVDFYCPSECLVIEIDGSIHDLQEQIVYDQKRTAFLEALGLRVIRIRNKQLLASPKKVLTEIAEAFSQDDK